MRIRAALLAVALAVAAAPASARAADRHAVLFAESVMSVFDGSQSAREAGTAYDSVIEHAEWFATNGRRPYKTCMDGRDLFRRMDGHGGKQDRRIVKREIRRWMMRFDDNGDGRLTDADAQAAAERYDALVKYTRNCRH